ncbi:lipase 3-like isoform X2 [Thrips palmi]|uniref:Lipase 3-like isoform X2 n=1 Tax=Thrips palmi TaxID=161013 RepID=A0A6P8Z955_THRPL|nr:lipase 3-like isoform X2 [Thrips palmi]
MPPLSERPTHCAVLVLLCLVSLAALEVLDVPGEHPAKLARSQGYLGDHHWATTEDGYLLSLFRIRNETALRAMGREKSPVLVMPGLACNAAIWVLLGPGKALAYLLADRGYDVWLGNYRGGMYARRHANLTDQDAAFWDFSFDDIGRLDVPALLQEVVALSGHPTVAYIGHSMGASVLTVMASSRPRYLERVSRAYLLAPAAYMGHALQPAVYGSAGAVSTLHVHAAVRPAGWRVRGPRQRADQPGGRAPLPQLHSGQHVDEERAALHAALRARARLSALRLRCGGQPSEVRERRRTRVQRQQVHLPGLRLLRRERLPGQPAGCVGVCRYSAQCDQTALPNPVRQVQPHRFLFGQGCESVPLRPND